MTKTNTMTKSIQFTAERKIAWLPIQGDLVAFREELIYNGNVVSGNEGISTLELIELATESNTVASVKKEFGRYNITISAFKKEVIEFIRHNPFGVLKDADELFSLEINKPYSFLLEHSVDEMELIYLDYGNHNCYNVDGNLIPKGIYFDYISAHTDNMHYDLDELLAALKDRSDIYFYHEEGIAPIPSYNSEHDRDQYIQFIWNPTDEDFAKIVGGLSNYHKRYSTIIEKIFGVSKKEILY